MTNLEAKQIAKLFIKNSKELVCWTEIKKAASSTHGLISKNQIMYDIFGRDIAKIKFRKNERIWEHN